MPQPIPDPPARSEPHDPWESIGDSGQAVGAAGDQGQSNDPHEAAQQDQEPLPQPQLISQDNVMPDDLQEGHDPDAFRGLQAEEAEAAPTRGGGWTLPLLCAGIALIACCVLIPQADANRRLAYEHQMLQMDLESVERQVAVNEEFLKKVADDPTLAERLAQRQMKAIPQGTRILELIKDPDGSGMSPFQLVSVAPPSPLPPYKPVGGTLARLCYDSHSRLYLIGASLGMIAMGLVLGYSQ
jgi:hypothetical protein